MLLAVYTTMRHDPANPYWDERDIFVLSKGHGALGHYAVLAEMGYFDPERLKAFGAAGSGFGCHADRFKVPGIEVSCGSLGHGIGVAAGIALAFKMRQASRRVFTLIGDGEANEGSVWEALMVASDRKLDCLTVLYDNNRSQTRCLQIPNPAERFQSFGCDTAEVDGHDIEAIRQALQLFSKSPKVVVCNTIKGKGCATLQNDVFAWHRRSPSQDEYDRLLSELHAQTV